MNKFSLIKVCVSFLCFAISTLNAKTILPKLSSDSTIPHNNDPAIVSSINNNKPMGYVESNTNYNSNQNPQYTSGTNFNNNKIFEVPQVSEPIIDKKPAVKTEEPSSSISYLPLNDLNDFRYKIKINAQI